MPEAIQVEPNGLNCAQRRAKVSDEYRLRPLFVSVLDAANYLGVSRSFFYENILPKVETAKLGRRNLIKLDSLDRLADSLK